MLRLQMTFAGELDSKEGVEVDRSIKLALGTENMPEDSRKLLGVSCRVCVGRKQSKFYESHSDQGTCYVVLYLP